MKTGKFKGGLRMVALVLGIASAIAMQAAATPRSGYGNSFDPNRYSYGNTIGQRPSNSYSVPSGSTFGNSYGSPSIRGPFIAENGDRRGYDNDGDGRRESTYVQGYHRNDGTYVRGHYRAGR